MRSSYLEIRRIDLKDGAAGRAPKDPLLNQGERHFFDALCVDPSDPSALNGLGSILMFERELDAAFSDGQLTSQSAAEATTKPRNNTWS